MLAKRILEIFVDESGNFGDIRDPSRYCMVMLVFRDAEADLSLLVRDYRRAIFNLGADPDAMAFHTAPLIRQEDQFSAMSRNMRGKIFYQMLSFVRKCGLRYKSFWTDTAYAASSLQVSEDIKRQLGECVAGHRDEFRSLENVRLHYDAGQKGVSRILDVLSELLPCPLEEVQGVRQRNSLMLQVADFLCTLRLIALKVDKGQTLNTSEKRFFGSARDFKRNVYRKISAQEL